MYASYVVRRTQIYLGDDQDARLAARAQAAGTTKSALIRDAIDANLNNDAAIASTDLSRIRAALTGAAGIAAYRPSGGEYVEDVRVRDSARLDGRRSA